MKAVVKLLYVAIALMAVIVSCTKDPSESTDKDDKSASVTGAASHISCRNAEIAGKANLPSTMSTDLTFGILYSTSSGVLLGSSTMIEAHVFDSEYRYTVETEVLEPETTYYYRSYVMQSGEITYGKVKSFKTLAVSSMIKTLEVSDINPKNAVLNASLDLTDCKYDGLAYGFEVKTESGETYSISASSLSQNKFSSEVGSLQNNTRYSVVAYARLDGRTYKGEKMDFTTASIKLSITAEHSNVMCNIANISGKLIIETEGFFSKSADLYYSSTASTLEELKSNGIKMSLDMGASGYYLAELKDLAYGKKYNYCVIATVDGAQFSSGIKSFTTMSVPEPQPYHVPELVDLGLSVKWASFNLGATRPEEYGGYFQWAGNEDVGYKYISISFDNCPYHVGSDLNSGWTKYVTSDNSSYWAGSGSPDNKTVLDSSDDIAHAILGGSWRMPTDNEWYELRNASNCVWEWTTNNGVAGFLVTSKKNGNSIFLPAAGARAHTGFSHYAGSYGNYWSSSLYGFDPCQAKACSFDSSGPYTSPSSRFEGLSVRPVSK